MLIIMQSGVPHCGYGRYCHIALVETTGDEIPCRIDARLPSVKKIIWDSGKVSVGKTEKAASVQAAKIAAKLKAQIEADRKAQG